MAKLIFKYRKKIRENVDDSPNRSFVSFTSSAAAVYFPVEWQRTGNRRKPFRFLCFASFASSVCIIHCTSRCCYFLLLCLMENQSLCDDNMEEEEAEYVLLDLDDISSEVHIPPNAPYVLSGLDTLNPILTIDGKIKLIGEYDETIGTCLVFNESDPVVHEEAGTSEANLFPGRHMPDPKQTKQVKPVTQLQKILKFRLLQDSETEDASKLKNPKED